MNKKDNLSDILKSHAPLAGTIGTVGGFAADVLAPLADFALYLFILGLVISLFLGLKWFKKRKPEILESISDGNLTQEEANDLFLNDKTSKAFSFSAITTGIMLVIMLGQFFLGDDEKGMFASTIPGLDKLQGQLLNIEEGINEIKQTTQDIKQDTAEIKDTTKDIKQDTSKILDGVTAVASKIDGFNDDIEEIKGLAGLIAEPKTFPEFAHNAKVHIEQERYDQANEIYEKLGKLGHKYFDIFSDHETVLRKLGKSSREIEDYFSNYPSKHGKNFGKLRLAIEFTTEKINQIADVKADWSYGNPPFPVENFDISDVTSPIVDFCTENPSDIIGSIYKIFFTREAIKRHYSIKDTWSYGGDKLEKEFGVTVEKIKPSLFLEEYLKVWDRLLSTSESALPVENDFRLQFSDPGKSLSKRFFWKAYNFGHGQSAEMDAVTNLSFEKYNFKDHVAMGYDSSDGFQNWALFFTIFANGEIWNGEGEDYGPDHKSYSGGKRVTWNMISRVKRFKDDYLHALKNGDNSVFTVVPDSTYTIMHEWIHYLSLDPKVLPNYSEWAFFNGNEKVEILSDFKAVLVARIKKAKAEE